MYAFGEGSADPLNSNDSLDNETGLIGAAVAGDAEAFATLFRRYRPRIFTIARHYFAPGSERDDLIQEATIGFFKAIRDFRGDRGTFASFVDMCVRRQVITYIKTATRQKHRALNCAISLDMPVYADSDETLINHIPAPENPAFGLDPDNGEFLSTLWKRCSALERGVLSMYTRGYSWRDMALELGVHYKSIDNTVWRIKVKAKKLLVEMPGFSRSLSVK